MLISGTVCPPDYPVSHSCGRQGIPATQLFEDLVLAVGRGSYGCDRRRSGPPVKHQPHERAKYPGVIQVVVRVPRKSLGSNPEKPLDLDPGECHAEDMVEVVMRDIDCRTGCYLYNRGNSVPTG